MKNNFSNLIFKYLFNFLIFVLIHLFRSFIFHAINFKPLPLSSLIFLLDFFAFNFDINLFFKDFKLLYLLKFLCFSIYFFRLIFTI